MMMDPTMPAEAFLYILQACEEGVESTDSWIRTHACSTINNICTFILGETEKAELRHEGKPEKKKTEANQSPCLAYIAQYPHLLPKLLSTLFGLILFDENNDQWQLSRPLYSLVLLERDVTCL